VSPRFILPICQTVTAFGHRLLQGGGIGVVALRARKSAAFEPGDGALCQVFGALVKTTNKLT
jgi:hypothetical protein